MVIGNPSQGDENDAENIWLKRQFAWDPAEFDGDIDATVDAWYADTIDRFRERTGFRFSDVYTNSTMSRKFGSNMRDVVKGCMKYRIQNNTAPYDYGSRVLNKFVGPGTRVFDELVQNYDEGLRPGEYRRPLVSAADSALRESFIKRATTLINNEDTFLTKHPVTGLPIDSRKYALRFGIPYPEGFVVPTFERSIETVEKTEGTDMNTLPLEVVVEFATLSAIIDRQGSKMNPGQVFQFLGNLDGSQKSAVGGLASSLMTDLGYGRGLDPADAVPLEELATQLENLVAEYGIQAAGETTTVERIIEENVPVMRVQFQDLRNPENSTMETIRLEDFFYTHRTNALLQEQVARLLPPVPQLDPDLYPNVGGTTANGWRQIGGRSGTYIVKFTRDPLDVLCISTGRAGSVPNQNSNVSCENGVEGYKYHLEVEEDGQMVIKEFRSPGWRSCQGLRQQSSEGYGSGPYEGIGYGECVVYLYPDDPHGWDRSKPLARLYLRWGFKDWSWDSSQAQRGMSDILSPRNLRYEDYRNSGTDFRTGGAQEPVICWEPRPYPADDPSIHELIRLFFNTAWEICAESYRRTGVGPSHQTFAIASTPYIVSGFTDVCGRQDISPSYAGQSIPTFSLQYSGGNLENLGGELPDYSALEDPLLTEEEAMARSSDITERPEAYEALANNATIWLYPAVIQNMRTYAAGMPALQMLSNSSFALAPWLRSMINSSALRLDEYYSQPWKGQNLVNTVTQNPQIFFDPMSGTTFVEAEKMIGSPGMSFSMHGHRYIYRGFDEDPEVIRQIFDASRDTDGRAVPSIDIGSAFELFYLGVLHPSNNLDPNASPTTPFISCLPAGNERITRGSPELRDLPIGVDAVAEDFLDGKITKRLESTFQVRQQLRRLIGYGVDLDVLASRGGVSTSNNSRSEEEQLYETMLVWRHIITSPWLSPEMFDAMLDWYVNQRNIVGREGYAGDKNGKFLSAYIMELNGLQVLQLWQYPFEDSTSRGFKNETGFTSVYQGAHTSWHNYGWQERQNERFTLWALTEFPYKLGFTEDNTLTTIESFLDKPLTTDGTTFAPFTVRTQEAFDALYSYMFTGAMTGIVGDTGTLHRFCLLFSPVSNTDATKPLLAGISAEDGGFLSQTQYQNLLTEALEDEGDLSKILLLFQYDFLPKSTSKRFRDLVPDEIQNQLLGRGEQVGYNLVSSFLRNPARIIQYTNQMMELALGDLYAEYLETGQWPTPPEGNLRRVKRENRMRLKILVSAAVGGQNNVGGLARNPYLPVEVAELVGGAGDNTWFELMETWKDYDYNRYLTEINTALALNEATPESVLTNIYTTDVSLQEQVAKNPNCSFEILQEIFGLIENEDGSITWADDASPLSAMGNPGLEPTDYYQLYDLVYQQLERDARSMDDSTLEIPTCFQVFDGAVSQFYNHTEGTDRTSQITSIIGSMPTLRYWRGGSDKSTWSGNIAGGDGGWQEFRWRGVDTDESCARTWRLVGSNQGQPSGLNITEADNGFGLEGKVSPGLEFEELGYLSSPFVMIKYNTPRASGRGDGNQTTCATYGDKPIEGKSTFGQMFFVQRLYKRQVGRGELRQNDDGTWVGRRYVWTFDGYWYDEDGAKHDGITYQAETLDEFFGWLGQERYQRIGFGEGRDGLKWSQGVVACITDAAIISRAEDGDNAFQYYFGEATETELQPVPLWRANWSEQDSVNLMRTIVTKSWADIQSISSSRDELRASPMRIYRPGAEPGTEPILNVSTLMKALDEPIVGDNELTIWTEELVESFAWDILQGGFDTFNMLKNLQLSINTPSIFIPLLSAPSVLDAWNAEDAFVREYAIRTNESNPNNVLNLIMAEFSTDAIDVTQAYLVENGVWPEAFRGTALLSGSRQRRNMIQHLLTNARYRSIIPIEFLTSFYTVHGVASEYLGDSNIQNATNLRGTRIDEFQRAYARQRALTIRLLSNYSNTGSEYALGQVSVGDGEGDPYDWPCFSDEMFVLASLEGRRFDGNAVRWPGYTLSNREAYIDRLMANRMSMVGVLTKSELRDLMVGVNYNCVFAKKVVLPMYEDFVMAGLEKGYGEEEADAASVIMIRSQLDSLVGEGQADTYLDTLSSSLVESGVDFSFLNDILGPEDWLDLEDFIDESITSGDIRTE